MGDTYPSPPRRPAPRPVPPRCSRTPVTSQTRHGKRSWVAIELSASILLAWALPSPFSCHTECNLQGRRVVPAAGCSVFAGALGVACPVPLGHALSGSFQVQKDIWDTVTTEKNPVIFQTTGQSNNLSISPAALANSLESKVQESHIGQSGETCGPGGTFLSNFWLPYFLKHDL